MAFFKFRQSGENPTPSTRPAENVEAMRQRAKHRLIGAAVLVLVGVVGFPLLFDTQPRPMPVDVQIEMPDKNKTAPLQLPAVVTPAAVPVVPSTAPSTPSAAVVAKPVEAKVSASASLDPQEQIVGNDAAKTAAKAVAVSKVASGPVMPARPASKPEPKPESKPEPKKPEGKPEPKPDDGARAKLLLEGKDAAGGGDDHRFIVQVGAFADPTKAREVRQKLEKAGLKTYTHVAETKEGQRIRVRVGPFASRAEAEKTADKVKGLSLAAAILTL